MAFEFVHRQHTYRKIEPEAIVALQLWPKTGFKKESHFPSPSRDLHQDCIEMDVWETLLFWTPSKIFFRLIQRWTCSHQNSILFLGNLSQELFKLGFGTNLMKKIYSNNYFNHETNQQSNWNITSTLKSLTSNGLNIFIKLPQVKNIKQIWGWNYVANSYASTARCVYSRSSWNRLNWLVTLI